jgi:predicted dehydrogenase
MSNSNNLSRRDVIKAAGTVAAASTLAGVVLPQVHAAGNELIRIALVGCGGRGRGAAHNALSTPGGPTRLIAMADVFQHKMNTAVNDLQQRGAQFDVPQNRRFIGFDAYRRAMDCLQEGDVVIMATPPAFRWPQFAYAIQKRLNVFMEKPTTVDGPSTRRMMDLATQSEQLGLKVGVGLMCRHCTARGELFDRIQQGQIGDLTLLRCYRMHGPVGSAFVPPRPANSNMTELLYQIAHFHGFLWASGGCYSDFYIHNIDECCWMKNAWPVKAQANGGRHYREGHVDQNFDSYSVEYTFGDGTKLLLEGRTREGCHQEFASYAHGGNGCAVISQSGHTPTHARMYRGHNFTPANLLWQAPNQEPNPYQLEWNNLMHAIRNNLPHNEARRGAEASLITAMGRMAAHTGQVVTRDQIFNSTHEFAPQVDQFTMTSNAPIQANANGLYPVPQPGIVTEREF